MGTGLFTDNFARTFTELLEKSGVTCYKIAQFSGLDEAYLSRLKNGEKRNPSVQTLMAISFSLVHFSDKIDLQDIHELFRVADRYPPIRL